MRSTELIYFGILDSVRVCEQLKTESYMSQVGLDVCSVEKRGL